MKLAPFTVNGRTATGVVQGDRMVELAFGQLRSDSTFFRQGRLQLAQQTQQLNVICVRHTRRSPFGERSAA